MGNLMKHPAGNFCWFELATTDQEGAKEFYTKLFGWQTVDTPLPPEMGGVYTMLTLDGKQVAATYTLGPDMAGVPTHWMPYVCVENADAIAARVAELGGEAMCPPFDVNTFGRMTAFKDPTGAMLSIWEPKEHTGADLVFAPGSTCWCELATRDVAGAKAFYSDLFGWKTKDSEFMAYTEWINGETAIGGLLPQDGPQWEGAPPAWLVYFAVEDADATAACAAAAGGMVCVQPTDIPNTGRFAVLADPQGGVFAIIQLTMPM
ncbi:MAG: VOC family protein [Blastocatellia bacterium]|nr:VOC family protein [Blastocatellia bacterium]